MRVGVLKLGYLLGFLALYSVLSYAINNVFFEEAAAPDVVLSLVSTTSTSSSMPSSTTSSSTTIHLKESTALELVLKEGQPSTIPKPSTRTKGGGGARRGIQTTTTSLINTSSTSPTTNISTPPRRKDFGGGLGILESCNEGVFDIEENGSVSICHLEKWRDMGVYNSTTNTHLFQIPQLTILTENAWVRGQGCSDMYFNWTAPVRNLTLYFDFYNKTAGEFDAKLYWLHNHTKQVKVMGDVELHFDCAGDLGVNYGLIPPNKAWCYNDFGSGLENVTLRCWRYATNASGARCFWNETQHIGYENQTIYDYELINNKLTHQVFAGHNIYKRDVEVPANWNGVFRACVDNPATPFDRTVYPWTLCGGLSSMNMSQHIDNDFCAKPFAQGDADYRRNCTLTFDANLNDFPYYILSDNSSLSYFYNESCDTESTIQLNHEVENWTADNATYHVAVNGTTGTIKVCQYINSTQLEDGTGNNPTSVWDTNYKGVWHLSEQTGNYLDSTSNNNDGAEVGTHGNRGAWSIVGVAVDFDGTADLVNISDSATLEPANITIEAWIKRDQIANRDAVLQKGSTSSADGRNAYKMESYDQDDSAAVANKTSVYITFEDTSLRSDPTTDSLTGEWHYVVSTYDSTTYLLYTDGVQEDTTVNVSGIDYTGGCQDFWIGMGKADGCAATFNPFDGTIDEVRISSTHRSADWINQTYNLINNQNTYVSCEGSWEAQVTTTTSIPLSIDTCGMNVTNNTNVADGDIIELWATYTNGSEYGIDVARTETNLTLNWTATVHNSTYLYHYFNTTGYPAVQINYTRVFINDSDGWTSLNCDRSFNVTTTSTTTTTTTTTLPAPPTLILPPNGTNTSDSTPFFDWEDSGSLDGTVQFTFNLDNDSDWSSPWANITNISNTFYQLPSALSEVLYYWRVQTHNWTDTTSWSEVWEVTYTTSGTCDDGIMNQDEEGIDCGGANCTACVVAFDLVLENRSFEAIAIHCENGYLDSEFGETDIDCGGYEMTRKYRCPPCGLNQDCSSDYDCTDTLYCHGDLTCHNNSELSYCSNGVRDSTFNESDIDCGGSCDRCSAGSYCNLDEDCASNSECVNRRCYAEEDTDIGVMEQSDTKPIVTQSITCSNGKDGRIWNQRDDFDLCLDDEHNASDSTHVEVDLDFYNLFNESILDNFERIASANAWMWVDVRVFRHDLLNGTGRRINILCDNYVDSVDDDCELESATMDDPYELPYTGDHFKEPDMFCAEMDFCSNFSYEVQFDFYIQPSKLPGSPSHHLMLARDWFYPTDDTTDWSFGVGRIQDSQRPNFLQIDSGELTPLGKTCAGVHPTVVLLDLRQQTFTDEWINGHSNIVNSNFFKSEVFLWKKMDDSWGEIYQTDASNIGLGLLNYLPYYVEVPLCPGDTYKIQIGMRYKDIWNPIRIQTYLMSEEFTFTNEDCMIEDYSGVLCMKIMFLTPEGDPVPADEEYSESQGGNKCVKPLNLLGYGEELCYISEITWWQLPYWGTQNVIVYLWPKWPSAYTNVDFSYTDISTWQDHLEAYIKFLVILLLQFFVWYLLLFYFINIMTYTIKNDTIPHSPYLLIFVFLMLICALLFQISVYELVTFKWLGVS